jgi:hypothetical protein
MALNAEGYFNGLVNYLNCKSYGVKSISAEKITLKEKIFFTTTERIQKVTLKSSGDVLAIKLDLKKPKGEPQSLFNFLDNTGKPWSKKCDFVIFHRVKSKIFVYCIEFKSDRIPGDAIDQLNATAAWVQSLHSIIKSYTNKKIQLNVKKFVFSTCPNPAPHLDAAGQYLNRDHSIRHYLYSEVDGLNLSELENSNIEIIR